MRTECEAHNIVEQGKENRTGATHTWKDGVMADAWSGPHKKASDGETVIAKQGPVNKKDDGEYGKGEPKQASSGGDKGCDHGAIEKSSGPVIAKHHPSHDGSYISKKADGTSMPQKAEHQYLKFTPIPGASKDGAMQFSAKMVTADDSQMKTAPGKDQHK